MHSQGCQPPVAHTNSPYITIYKRDGDMFNKLPNPAALPPNVCYGVAWSPDRVHLILTHTDNSPYVTIYKRNGDTFTKLANPSVLPTAGSGMGCAAFSPDGVHLAASHILSPFITIYKRNGDTLTKLSNPATLPQTGLCATYSPDGLYLVIGNVAASYICFYKRSGDTYTAVSPALTHSQQMSRLAFSMDGTYLVGVFSSSLPYIVIYKRGGHFKTATSGSLTLKPKTLSEISNSVFIMDEAVMDAGVSRVYDVSLDGGTTWETVSAIGEVVTLNHSGTQLVIRLRYTRSVSGVGEGKVYWIAVWAGVV